jgi:formylmethanofuran dehydrogenase subunit E
MTDTINLLDLMPEKDERPKKDGWATGWYINIKCNKCHKPYMGDKRSVTCAPCAYGDKTI